MLAQLIPLDDGPTITLSKDVNLVGRKPGLCDVVIDRTSVSKLQCLLVKTDGLLYVRDLASTNGTKVNGQRISRGALLPGDELSFASVCYRIHLGPDSPDEHISTERTEMLTAVPENGKPKASPPDSGSDSDVRFVEE